MLPNPLNLPRWLEENKHLLAPPVNNYCVYRGNDFIVMLVGGPNKRTDYHINPTEEWFFQVKGDMLLKVVESDGSFRDVVIKEGDMYLLPPDTPHNPVRFADTIGIVIERPRPAGKNDALRWYCSNCKAIVHEDSFYCVDLGTQLKPVIEQYAQTPALRTCKKCGTVNEAK
ncbi:3-hydroxyanthranilate 3,4-dioxygenase [Allomyces macrogynus ATCC 38327]|uniref:3-hydroxyanthranilate 3,4-dioxygenase n=1 Tax=Allomyces macrogynus (strain ATCC 38327) TaxID=578462 RepID=A0A0L0TBY1_ALLM3|nr:3-hydroxyanthranilic acid dioxygenase [Allomyces javanicus]KNE72226.1 3-hydroxyanthranilate 3,4-dioxygenase [Allomyces macrogynus ATCC 38327]|eukprot:KNE72226.1 3-hydroxyanthranilate 3,4-dioxygenase [Allomyces macrogynus ATCC 38327]